MIVKTVFGGFFCPKVIRLPGSEVLSHLSFLYILPGKCELGAVVSNMFENQRMKTCMLRCWLPADVNWCECFFVD